MSDSISFDLFIVGECYQLQLTPSFEMLIEKNMTQLRSEIQGMRTEILQEMDKRFKEVDKRFDEVNERFNRVERRIDVLEERTEGLKTSVYWGLTFMGIILAMIVFAPTLVKIFQIIFRPSVTLEDVQRLIEANNANLFQNIQSIQSK